jgi:RNA methyltransferase, TrmH family
LLNPGNSTVLNGASYRVAEGGAEAQPFFALQNDDDVQALKAAGFSFIASQMRQAKPLWGNKFAKKVVLIFGAEGTGVSDYMHRNADLRLQIPGTDKVESLNVAQSAAIVLAELQRQRG